LQDDLAKFVSEPASLLSLSRSQRKRRPRPKSGAKLAKETTR
jgi:hypothetical protein